ncbi:MAG: tRNA uridine-5-carboxymethylaminomethyl(34) synthesis GTPase MnmE [Rhodospirillales bacterium]|nr:tRNA uridine-5-carboxymethylaminomethyl(34) synthesis GTPase MnmE [Rhodospirillales bacterium]
MADADTIFAVASGAGRAAVAVVRISGPQTSGLIARLAGRLPAPRRAVLRTLRDAEGDVLDQALVLWFPGPRSYSGEDCAELHLHGGPAVVDGMGERLVGLGARPAEPGEFTRRAFLHGRMDLVQAEAVADLVAAETSAQRRQALQQLGGTLGRVYSRWSERLLRLLAQQEALIDFPDEHLPADTESAMLAEIAALREEIARHLADDRRGERLRDGLVFAVVGAPNVGKSTLINALAGREAAIVSPQPGTTRDVLEVRVVLGGAPVTLLDTAGLRETADAIEAEGVRRARARAQAADLEIVVQDGSEPACPAGMAARRLVVASKADLGDTACEADLRVSALTGFGMDGLRHNLERIAGELTGAAGPPALTRARHRAALTEAVAALARAGGADLPELRGEDLRSALMSVGRITGAFGAEDVLDSVFAQFCIGK